MVRYSSHVLNSELLVLYLYGKSYGNQVHLVTELFTMAANPMVRPDHSISDHLNTERVKVCYLDKFAIKIPIVLRF